MQRTTHAWKALKPTPLSAGQYHQHMPPPPAWTIRNMHRSDASAVAVLATQLGYPSGATEMDARLASLIGRSDEFLLVAVGADGVVVGWIHATLRRKVETDDFVQIAALVVDEACRSEGIGSDLLRQSEQWALTTGVSLVRLSSNVIRDRAHAFYVRAGYAVTKTSVSLSKALAPRQP